MPTQSPPAESHAAANVLSTLATLRSNGFASLAAASTLMSRRAGGFGGEVMAFTARRMAEEARTGAALLRCRHPADLPRIQAAFLGTAIAQYRAEAERMMRLGDELMRCALPGAGTGEVGEEGEAAPAPLAAPGSGLRA